MKNKIFGLIMFFSLLFYLPVCAQEITDNESVEQEDERDKDVVEAYEAFDAKQYYFAIELLKDAFTEVRGREDKVDITFKLAECYRYTLQYEDAARSYERAQKLGYDDPEVLLLKGHMLKAQEEFEDAIEAYQEFEKAGGNGATAQQAIAATREAIQMKDKPSLYQVYPMDDINSDSYDMSVIYGGKARENNVLIFESTREEAEGNDEDGWLGTSFSDLFTTTSERKRRGRGRANSSANDVPASEMKWSTPALLDEEEIVNTEHHDGAPAFDSRKKTLYFTRCEIRKNEQTKCAIYTTELVGNAWREPERVFIISDSTANVGQPTLSLDDSRLYFVSDDFNTRGAHDIFMTTFDRRTRTWKDPINLGSKVNTKGEEYFPVVNKDGYLYYSTDGKPGMGGWDIWRVKLGPDGLPEGDAEHMEYPINTSRDDYHLIFESEKSERGFLSSNRGAGTLDDIYAVFKTPTKFNLEGVVRNSNTGEPVPLVVVRLEGSDGTSVISNTDNDGYYKFDKDQLNSDVNYQLNFEKKQYLNSSADVTTIGVPLSAFQYIPSEKHFLHTLTVNKTIDPIEKPIVLPNVLFDLAKWDLRPEAMVALDSVVTILKENPQVVLELRSHTDYRGSDKANETLSQNRADTCVSYLVSKGINPQRLVARGMGETEPFEMPKSYDGYGAGTFEAGVVLSEKFITSLAQPDKQEVANQINRRTDIKVLRTDFVPEGGLPSDSANAVSAQDVLDKKAAEAQQPGKIYIVQGRESFGRIASKFKISYLEMRELNGGLRGVRPFEGLQLKVEPEGNYAEFDRTHYQIQRRGEDLSDIAKKLDMKKKDLEELNPDLDERMLQPGYWVRIKK